MQSWLNELILISETFLFISDCGLYLFVFTIEAQEQTILNRNNNGYHLLSSYYVLSTL